MTGSSVLHSECKTYGPPPSLSTWLLSTFTSFQTYLKGDDVHTPISLPERFLHPLTPPSRDLYLHHPYPGFPPPANTNIAGRTQMITRDIKRLGSGGLPQYAWEAASLSAFVLVF